MQHEYPEPTGAGRIARQDAIAFARQVVLGDRVDIAPGLVAPWIERSWRRCLQRGQVPENRVTFDAVPAVAMRRAREANAQLIRAAAHSMEALGRALARTRYFAVLTNAHGVVVDVSGPIDRSDPRAALITRIGVDLSERSVGTTAIGAALADLQPVWLHRGEHFFNDTSVYSCAGMPLFGPTGQCIGMLDLTGVDVPERPELLHLAMQSARSIENALTHQRRHAVMLRLNWPGQALGTDTDALIGLDGEGRVSAFNKAAQDMVPQLQRGAAADRPMPHAGELFALPFENLFDAARREAVPIDLPLWSGLRLQALALPATTASAQGRSAPTLRPGPVALPAGPPGQRRLRDVETAMIRKAVEETRGNVAEAAARLGVSRATVYRKLGQRNEPPK